LKKLGLDGCIRIKEEPDKDAMAKLDDDAVRKVKDEFFLEANNEEINKDLLKEQLYRWERGRHERKQIPLGHPAQGLGRAWAWLVRLGLFIKDRALKGRRLV
jgi:hypothetical protein